MKNKDYKGMIETANKALEGLNLDDNLKLKAFEKILDDLMGNVKQMNTQNTNNPQKHKKSINKNNTPNIEKSGTDDILNKLNAEDFDKIHNLNKSLDWALYLLYILREKYEVDGLIPSEISVILSEKFRIKVNQFGVGMALMKAKMKAKQYVDRHKTTTRGGTAYKYRIMKNGEDYIKNKLSELTNQTGPKAEEPKPNLSSEEPQDNSEIAN